MNVDEMFFDAPINHIQIDNYYSELLIEYNALRYCLGFPFEDTNVIETINAIVIFLRSINLRLIFNENDTIMQVENLSGNVIFKVQENLTIEGTVDKSLPTILTLPLKINVLEALNKILQT
jgi:hypothetical protein